MKVNSLSIIIALIFSCSFSLGTSAQTLPRLDVMAHTLPLLVNKPHNPVMSLRLFGRHLKTLALLLDFSDSRSVKQIRAVRIFRTGSAAAFDTSALLSEVRTPTRRCRIPLDISLLDSARLWLSIELDPGSDISQTYRIECLGMETDAGMLRPAAGSGSGGLLRAGYALRKHGDDGVDTYRIPGLATTLNGTLLAIYDARRASSRDLQGDIDITLNRSTDGGRTWLPMQVVMDMGKWGGLPEKFNGVSDASVLVDQRTGDIYIAGLWMHGVLDEMGRPIPGLDTGSKAWNHQWRNRASQAGFDVTTTSQFLISKSTDDGQTWSSPVNITRIKDSAWWLLAPAPGRGITLRDGTLLIPSQGRDSIGRPFSNITYSRDGGVTWKTSRPATFNTTECQAVQLEDGGIMLNIRHNANRTDTGKANGRAVAITYDMGETWAVHPTSRNTLTEPTCMASIYRHDLPGNRGHLLFFSNPNAQKSRTRMTVKVSTDDGMTWPEPEWMLLDVLQSRGYSCLTSVDRKTLGILYESSQADMVFQRLQIPRHLLRKKIR